MINTYNESNLHLTLKKIYATEFNGKCEVPIEGTKWIADIETENGNIIEIQTSNISALKQKIEYVLSIGKKITVVHPVISEKFIELYLPDGTLRHRKKSPKKETEYSILRSLTGIHHLLLHKNFTLEILFCKVTETRRETSEPVQLVNKSRNHLKNWIPQGKRLEEILEKIRFVSKENYTNLIPEDLHGKIFTMKDLYNAISATKNKNAAKWSNLLVWLLLHLNLVEQTGKKGNAKLYALKTY